MSFVQAILCTQFGQCSWYCLTCKLKKNLKGALELTGYQYRMDIFFLGLATLTIKTSAVIANAEFVMWVDRIVHSYPNRNKQIYF